MLVMVSVIAVGFMSAQKNTLLVGGNIGYESEKVSVGSSDTKSKTFEFSPTVGYQFNDNWTAGVQSTIGSTKITAGGTDEAKTSNFSIGGFVRYAQGLNDTFAVYGDLGAGYQTEKNKIADITGNGFYIGFTPALFINFKNSFGLNFSIGGIRYETLDWDGGADTSGFNLNFGKTVNIGISKNFKL